ncbi:MAG TPA: ATP-binding protein [Gemmataceae bacterium]|jgi:hypothetical protein|nr:ATP-binding protein [Gemmataceae bacterium]
MKSALQQFTGDLRSIVEEAARVAGCADPVALDLGEFYQPLLGKAWKGPLFPLDGVLIRDWNPNLGRAAPGVAFGMRLFEIEGIRFVHTMYKTEEAYSESSLTVVGQKDYRRLYQIALRCRRDQEISASPPVMAEATRDSLWKNSIGYLERENLSRIKEYGGRPQRGILLTGPPGNGKTMACRWLWQECRRRRWDWRLVSPDGYAGARRAGNAEEAVRELFELPKKGIIFFDDLDLALRDREMVRETDDQAVFLGALDGINVKQGVVFIFTTNCSSDLIDRAFKRPGRIDVVLQFDPPDDQQRRELMERWHADIRAHLDWDRAIAMTAGFSFAELDELKNLLIIHFMDHSVWDWDAAFRQMGFNRQELRSRTMGFEHFVAKEESLWKGNGTG